MLIYSSFFSLYLFMQREDSMMLYLSEEMCESDHKNNSNNIIVNHSNSSSSNHCSSDNFNHNSNTSTSSSISSSSHSDSNNSKVTGYFFFDFLYSTGWGGSSLGALGNTEYLFIIITLRSTLIRSENICYGSIYGLNRTVQSFSNDCFYH